ncbi:pyridoxamine 5'-phosphate oxidase family protein [Reyranella aquatilis]|jgi:PPOX class probable FMN-dependent enzyme|uniref:Pyridoxamine 5'-phosphate oxidase family protein n=1 Tax=Reyranella aquatilis TaxID=2035356 RepID=A0ABS8L3A0_9HYPH|nr:pyridoxamine 5'-phosphate oxidase family protein [Reyranella aquatilis]MCC8432799.1 pyridoxamine 5'-phosphate oxidase family protein [Reyranella aquatilis]
MSDILRTEAELEAIYGRPLETSTVKEVNWITPHYRAYIEASPYAALATCGPEGLDCSPRGDKPGFVRIHDEKTLMLPDRRGNNRIDSLRNIVRDPRVALLFMIPGVGNTLRVNGRAHLSVAPDLLESFAVEEKAPRSVTVIEVDAVYFQCARALVRSELWNPARHVDPKSLPSAGQILAALSGERVGGETYDREWPGRAAATMW